MSEDRPDDGTAPAVAGAGRGRRRRSWRRRAAWTLAGLAALLALTLAALLRSGRGQQLVLERALDRIRGALAGELTVRDIRSGGMLRGATLIGVRLDAQGGRPFLEADSVALRYSVLGLLTGGPLLRSTIVHGLRLEISRRPGEERLNVKDVLRPRADDGTAGGLPRLALGNVGVRRGTVVILTPADSASDTSAATAGGATAAIGVEGGRATGPAAKDGAGGSPHAGLAAGEESDGIRRFAFEEVDLDLEDVVLAPREGVNLEAGLASLSMTAEILEEPLVVHEAFGDVTFGDAGLQVREGAFRLPESLLRGSLGFGPEAPGAPWGFTASLDTEGWGDLADLAWLDGRTPPGRFRGGADVRVRDGIAVRLRGFNVELEASELVATGRVTLDERVSFDGLRVTARPLVLSRLAEWGGPHVPIEGWLSGEVTLDGTPGALRSTGRLTLVPTGYGGEATTAEFSGTLHGGSNPGVTDFEVRLDPVNARIVEAFAPGSGLTGRGTATLELDGRVEDGLVVVADLTHARPQGPSSRVLARGTVWRPEGALWHADLRGELAPLSLEALAHLVPEGALTGTLEGPVRVVGPVNALRLTGDLSAGGGRLEVETTADLTDPASGYLLDARAERVALSELTGAVPEPTEWTGHLTVEGRGFDPDALVADVLMSLVSSRVGGLAIDTVAATLHVADGTVTADTVSASVGGVRLAGRGALGLARGSEGRAVLAFETSSLTGLRPFFMGDSIIVRDSLSLLEQDFLRVQGVDPDTLPLAEDVRMQGSVRGTAELFGAIDSLDVRLAFDLVDAAYGHNSVDSARVALAAGGLPATTGAWDVEVEARGLTWLDRSFDTVVLDATMTQRRGEGMLRLTRLPSEEYTATGSFALDSLGGDVRLTEATATLDERAWTLVGPARVTWTDRSVSLDSLKVERVGPDPMRVVADGTLAWGASSDFRLDVDGLHVDQLIRALQLPDLDAGGHLDLDVTVAGPAEEPVIEAQFQIEEPRYDSLVLTRVGGSLAYAGRNADVRVDVWDGERPALTVAGSVPLDLALTDVEQRRLALPMDLAVTADSLDASVALAYLGSLTDVQGTISADFRVRGTSLEPEPSGIVELEDAAWTIDALGVRHTGINGELSLQPSRIVDVSLEGATEGATAGRSVVSGEVTLEPLVDPELGLTVAFERFLAVERSDMEAAVSGEFALTGTYRRPQATGSLVVDEATLFVEEFARNAEVLDLRDPRLVSMGVDTTVFVSQPILGDLRNPFLDSLRVDIDLAVPRNMWIRSDEMDVEMGGELIVVYDRSEADLVLVGELQALRGSYEVFGRTFEVSEGTVSFIGTPGVNPTLNIAARSRVRRQEDTPLEVVATVEGTLIQPVVTLSTDEPGLGQADLVSYLVFGVPSGQLVATGRASAALEGAVSAGFFAGLEAVGTQLSTALAQELGLGLDYVALSLDRSAPSFSSSQLEAGRYLGDDVFVALILQDPGAAGAAESTTVDQVANVLRGVRLEVAITDLLSAEIFVEDRFLRSALAGQGSAQLGQGDRIVGVVLFREWGY